MKPFCLVCLAPLLMSCGLAEKLAKAPDRAIDPEVAAVTPAPPSAAATADEFDTTTEAERVAALAGLPAGERELGRTVASLGNPAAPGFWLETPLVSEVMQGRVVYPPTGNSVAVELRPISGPATAGSRVSLPTLRLLGAPLTGLPELTVYGG